VAKEQEEFPVMTVVSVLLILAQVEGGLPYLTLPTMVMAQVAVLAGILMQLLPVLLLHIRMKLVLLVEAAQQVSPVVLAVMVAQVL
jgi:hypothetical protein